MTHFTADGTRTLCGLTVTGYVMNRDKADCQPCVEHWATTTEWAFPLPPVVTGEEPR